MLNIKIKELRKEKNLTQGQLAKLSGLATSCISMIETGQREANAHTIRALAAALNVSSDYLLGLEDDNIKPNIQTTLSYREQKLLKAFNLLEEDEKDKIIDDCEYFANKHIKTNQQRKA